MAKHRARLQKQKPKSSRGRSKAPAVPIVHERQVEPHAPQLVIPAEASLQRAPNTPILPSYQPLLRVDQRYLRADLRRSLSVSLALFVVLIGIYWLVRYNGLTTLQSWF